MNPDQEHEKWVKDNPPYMHKMSPETKEAIKEVKKEVDKKIDELKVDHIKPLMKKIEDVADNHKKDMEVIEAKVESKVSFKIFTWVLGILMMVVVGIQGVIWIKVNQTYDKTTQTGSEISLINYRLNQFESVK